MAPKSKPSSRQIAVIEENANNIYSLKFVLDSLGFHARSYTAGTSYMNDLLAFSPQLILVDMMIAAGGGFTVLSELEKKRELRKVPVIAITADAMEGETEDIYKSGARDILSKPFSITDLKKTLDRWLKKAV
ncbi:MAG: response regulator [Acidobacteria bacterium]|nr:response regulator [Acidobacteriota bacterium]